MNSPNKSATISVADFLFYHFFKRLLSRTRVINPDSPGLRLSADNLYFNAPNPDRLTASLADTSGRIVAAATMEDGTTAINVAQLPEGIYIATLKSDKKLILSEKILVSHR